MFSSDDDVLNSTISTLEIFQDSKFKRREFSEDEKSLFFDSESNELTKGVSSNEQLSYNSHKYSVFLLSMSNDQIMNGDEIKIIIDNIQKVNEKYNELEKLWQLKEKSDTEAYITDYFADLIQASNVRTTVERIKSVICHLQTIFAERLKLKQEIRSNVVNDVWHMKKDYHKSVIIFFSLATDLIKNANALITALENRKCFCSDGLETMQTRERKFHQVLNENLEILEKLQSFTFQHGLNLNT